MTRFLFLSIVFIALFSCQSSSNDQGLCKCVEAGDQVNKLSASFFDGSFPASRIDSLEKAKSVRDSLCAPYEEMMPEELHNAAQNCESLKMDLNER